MDTTDCAISYANALGNKEVGGMSNSEWHGKYLVKNRWVEKLFSDTHTNIAVGPTLLLEPLKWAGTQWSGWR